MSALQVCDHCGQEVTFSSDAISICLPCALDVIGRTDQPTRAQGTVLILFQRLENARRSLSVSYQNFQDAVTQFSGAQPPTDGAQRIHTATQDLVDARHAMSLAHNQLSDFLGRGILPKDIR
jgi:hypothetical protein